MTPEDAAPPRESVAVSAPDEYEIVDRRTVVTTVFAIVIAIAAGLAAQLLLRLIALVTNLSFYHRFSIAHAEPAGAPHSVASILIMPILGALIVGVMARYGSPAIRGHGIPEVMERVLYGESRMSARVAILKPLSAAIAIGTGGPFGAEGPIIATGGALGSVGGQFIRVTADERKTLLAAGAAAGMTSTFGSPVSAVLLVVELLLGEYRPRSLIPVALASAVATGIRAAFEGTAPVFAAPNIAQPSLVGLGAYTLLGLLVGLLAVGITRATYGMEDVFEHFGERFHVHWMWWPAIGAVVVGLVGLVEPRTLGIGYSNISGALAGSFTVRTLLLLAVLKFVSWVIYLASGTSGGTLAPLFTIGSALGGAVGALVAMAFPQLGVDPRVAALVGMAAIFAGATHALLASIVFAFETTRQPLGLLPLLSGCSASYLISLLLMRGSILTEKLLRRGATLRREYAADHLAHVAVRDAATRDVVALRASDTLGAVRQHLSAPKAPTHQGFPVVNDRGMLVGVVTRRDLFDPARDDAVVLRDLIRRAPVVVYEDNTLRDAADHMVLEGVGRLPVVRRDAPRVVIGIVTRSDLLAAHAPRLRAARDAHRVRNLLGVAETESVDNSP